MRANARPNTAEIDSTTSVDLKSARVGRWTLVDKQFSGRHKLHFGPRAVLRGSHARGIFRWESLSKVANSFEPYPTNIP
jgi:hypothetical protein